MSVSEGVRVFCIHNLLFMSGLLGTLLLLSLSVSCFYNILVVIKNILNLKFKNCTQEKGSWREACRLSAPLLLLALSLPIDMQSTWLLHAAETWKKSVDLWAKETAYRNSQAGNYWFVV